MTISQKLRERLQKKCPELMELSFGCKIKTGDEEGIIISQDEYGFQVLREGLIEGFDMGRARKGYITEILGHPPQLSHLLKAISQSLKTGDVINAHINSYNSLCFRSEEYPGLTDYNLDKLPCDQSEEVCERLLELI